MRSLSLALGSLLLGACSPDRLPSTSVDEDTEETGDQPACDWEAYQACLVPVGDAHETCTTACVEPMLICTDEMCSVACDVQSQLDREACKDAHCPGSGETSCVHDCMAEAVACSEGDCELHECSYGMYLCLWDDCTCGWMKLDYAWANSCEILLPGPLHPSSNGATRILVGDLDELVGVAAHNSCSDADVVAVLSDERDRITLCTDACQAFADVGVLRVDVDIPPCE